MSAFDPIAFSRELEICNADARAWQSRLRNEPDPEDPGLDAWRSELSLSSYQDLSEELREADPLRAPLQRWVHFLLEQRVNHWWYTHLAHLRYGKLYGVEEPKRAQKRIAELIRELLCDPRGASFLRALESAAPQLSDATSMLRQRQVEIAVKLGRTEPAAFSYPVEKPAELHALCEQALTQTAELAEAHRVKEPAGFLKPLMSPLPNAEFPARLNERHLSDWFRDSRLLEAAPLRRFPLPEALGGVSFVRALDQLGSELRWTLASRKQPFVIAHDPYGLEQHALGHTFASLFTLAPFLVRNLNVARASLRDVQRRIATWGLFELRLRAAAVLMDAAAYQGRKAAVEAHQALGEQVFGVPLPQALTLVIPRARHDAPQRFAGALLGETYVAELVQQHDEDWYRNPRAVEQVRSDAELSPRTCLDVETLQSGLTRVVERLKEALR